MWPAEQRTVDLICCQTLKIFITSTRRKQLDSETAFIFLGNTFSFLNPKGKGSNTYCPTSTCQALCHSPRLWADTSPCSHPGLGGGPQPPRPEAQVTWCKHCRRTPFSPKPEDGAAGLVKSLHKQMSWGAYLVQSHSLVFNHKEWLRVTVNLQQVNGSHFHVCSVITWVFFWITYCLWTKLWLNKVALSVSEN